MPRSLAALLQDRFGTKGIPFTNRLNVASIGTTAVRIFGNDPNRLALIFVNLSANNIFFHLDNTVSLTKGIFCGPNGGGLSYVWDEDFELTSGEQFVIASAVASNYLAYEIVSAGA